MSLSDQERQVMIDLHIEKADDLAMNRYYYACFHALHALFVANGLYARTHDGLITLFGKEFVQTGKVDKQYGRYLARMEQLRKLADYNCTTNITEDEVDELRQPAHSLIETIKELIKNKSIL